MLPLPANRIIVVAALATIHLAALGQSANFPITDSIYHYRDKIHFIQEAPCLLPPLVEQHEWTQVQNFLDHWKVSPVPSHEYIFAITTLMLIERREFLATMLPYGYTNYLEDYARLLGKLNDPGTQFKYLLRIAAQVQYDATPDARSLAYWIQAWSRKLLAADSLSASEKFFCQVFAGDIDDPRATLKEHGSLHADLQALELSLAQSKEDYFQHERDKLTGSASIMTGIWVPTGNLSILGIHPSIGVSAGWRNKLNQYDIVWAFRFPGSSLQPYQFARHDTLYSSHYYDGGYIGLDYTRYLVHRTRYEFGVIGAAGYDYFSVASGFGDNTQAAAWGNLNQGSFDFNTGIRFKYFLKPRQYLGLALKYHMINYVNNGGTDMGGNAFTLDLSFGSH